MNGWRIGSQVHGDLTAGEAPRLAWIDLCMPIAIDAGSRRAGAREIPARGRDLRCVVAARLAQGSLSEAEWMRTNLRTSGACYAAATVAASVLLPSVYPSLSSMLP